MTSYDFKDIYASELWWTSFTHAALYRKRPNISRSFDCEARDHSLMVVYDITLGCMMVVYDITLGCKVAFGHGSLVNA